MELVQGHTFGPWKLNWPYLQFMAYQSAWRAHVLCRGIGVEQNSCDSALEITQGMVDYDTKRFEDLDAAIARANSLLLATLEPASTDTQIPKCTSPVWQIPITCSEWALLLANLVAMGDIAFGWMVRCKNNPYPKKSVFFSLLVTFSHYRFNSVASNVVQCGILSHDFEC